MYDDETKTPRALNVVKIAKATINGNFCQVETKIVFNPIHR